MLIQEDLEQLLVVSLLGVILDLQKSDDGQAKTLLVLI